MPTHFAPTTDLHLPSEQQYERAARGTDGAPFPGARPRPTSRAQFRQRYLLRRRRPRRLSHDRARGFLCRTAPAARASSISSAMSGNGPAISTRRMKARLIRGSPAIPGAARRLLEQRSRPPHHHLPARLRSGIPFRGQWRFSMRALRTAILTAGFVLLSAASIARAQRLRPGYRIETFSMPGAAFAGLSRDGDGAARHRSRRGQALSAPIGRQADCLRADLPARPRRDRRSDWSLPRRTASAAPMSSRRDGRRLTRRRDRYDHALVAIDDGEARVISSDFWNPFDFIVSGKTYYVVDAARNSVERLKSDGTRRETIYAFSRIDQAALLCKRSRPPSSPGKAPTRSMRYRPASRFTMGAYTCRFSGAFPSPQVQAGSCQSQKTAKRRSHVSKSKD